MATETLPIDDVPDRAYLPRFTIRGLLILTAAVSGLLAPIALLGPRFSIVVLPVAALLGLVAWFLHRRQTAQAMVVSAVFAVAGFLLFQLALFAIAAGCFLVTWATYAMADHTRLRVGLCYAVGLAVVWALFAEVQQRVGEVDAMRADYPLVSMRERTPVAPPLETPMALSANLQTNLDAFDDRHRIFRNGSGRAGDLERLHHASYRRFVASPGFGAMRMRRISPQWLELAEIDRTSLPIPLGEVVDETGKPGKLHTTAVASFLSPDALGYVRSRDEVAGFEPHAFRGFEDILETSDLWELESAARGWRLEQIELVSLLMHDEPRVYVTDGLPRMDEVAQYETRDLDDFEQASLPKLERESDVLIDEQETTIRMLGAIRAGKDCLECHQAQRGQLLGAFSYGLTRR